ncbi:flagellar hook protein FlgE [Citrobacter koseri]|uniref:Flagellar hook protein FlgE n=1 Tax=Citrobacter koseri TaxID=545 RepID=A0A2X2UYX5_CITKO|nr:flagellar hook protein FlgE [Citrobacter koseri]
MKDGSVYATFSNGERMLQGQLVAGELCEPEWSGGQKTARRGYKPPVPARR